MRPIIRRAVRGKPRPSGIDRVFLNLVRGLDRIGLEYTVNIPFSRLCADDRVGVLGRGRNVLRGYDRENPIVAAIALMTHPSEWPTLCDDYPVVTYLSHSEWVNEIYRPYFADRCRLWPVGIDTTDWAPDLTVTKTTDVLIYNKIRKGGEFDHSDVIAAVRDTIARRGLSSQEIVYGEYSSEEFNAALQRARCMVFLSAHESQGIAYQEAMATGVPIVAWDPGWSEDPERFAWGAPRIPTASVPFFDERCGTRFTHASEFPHAFDLLQHRMSEGSLDPRGYILEHLTIEHCSQLFVDHLDESRTSAAAARLSTVWRSVHFHRGTRQ